MLLIEGGRREEEMSNRKERQANHTVGAVTYLHIMVRIGLINEISQSSCLRMEINLDSHDFSQRRETAIAIYCEITQNAD